MKKSLRITSFLTAILLIAAVISVFSVFADNVESIIYTVRNKSGDVIAADDYKLLSTGAHDIFVPGEAETVEISPVTKENETPVYTLGSSVATVNGETGTIAFTVSGEEYSLRFIAENEINELISDIDIICRFNGSEENILADFKPFLFGYSVFIPDEAADFYFSVTAKDGAEIKINGEAVKDGYLLSSASEAFVVSASYGESTYYYTIRIYADVGLDYTDLMLFTDDGHNRFERSYRIFGASELYILEIPDGFDIFNIVLPDGFSLTSDGAPSDGIGLIQSGDAVYGVYNENGFLLYSIKTAVGKKVETVYTGVDINVFDKNGNLIGNAGLGLSANDTALSAVIPDGSDSVEIIPQFDGDVTDFVITANGEEYHIGDEIVLPCEIKFSADGVEERTLLLSFGRPVMNIRRLSFDCFDTNGNLIYGDSAVFSEEITVPNATAKIIITAVEGDFISSFDCEEITLPENAVITVRYGEASSDISVSFIGDEASESERPKLKAIFTDAHGKTVSENVFDDDFIIPYSAINAKIEIMSNKNQNAVLSCKSDIECCNIGDVISVTVNGSKVFDYTVIRKALDTDLSVGDISVVCLDASKAVIGTVGFDSSLSYIDFPVGTRFFRFDTRRNCEILVNGVLSDGQLFEYRAKQSVSVACFAENGLYSSYSFVIFCGNRLASLNIDGFDPAVFDYSLIAPENADSVSLEAVAADINAVIVNTSPAIFTGKTATITVTVTSADGFSEVYTAVFTYNSTKLRSDILLISETTGFVSNIEIGTNVEDLIKMFKDSQFVKVFKGEKEVTSGKAGTGMTVKLILNENVCDTKTVVIYGDVTGDGKANSSDILSIILNKKQANLTGCKFAAADITDDGKTNTSDILKILLYLHGGKINQNR